MRMAQTASIDTRDAVVGTNGTCVTTARPHLANDWHRLDWYSLAPKIRARRRFDAVTGDCIATHISTGPR